MAAAKKAAAKSSERQLTTQEQIEALNGQILELSIQRDAIRERARELTRQRDDLALVLRAEQAMHEASSGLPEGSAERMAEAMTQVMQAKGIPSAEAIGKPGR